MATRGNVLRILLALALAITVTSATERCEGYEDKDGKWHEGFECDIDFKCCENENGRNCCAEIEESNTGGDSSTVLIGIIVGSVVALIIIIGIIVAVCLCVYCAVQAGRTQRTTHRTVIVGSNQMTTVNTQRSATTGYQTATYPTQLYTTQPNPAGAYPPQQYSTQPYPPQQQQYPPEQQQYPYDPPPEYPGKQ